MTVAHYSPVLPVLIGNSKTFGKFVIETFQFEEQDKSSPREESEEFEEQNKSSPREESEEFEEQDKSSPREESEEFEEQNKSSPREESEEFEEQDKKSRLEESKDNKPKKPCNVLDFSEGVYIVSSSSERRSRHDAVVRLLERQNESQYNVCFNNCEHIVNDILYETPTSNQSESMVCCSNIIGGLLDLRGIGVRIVMMVLVVSALLGVFIRQTQIRVLASAVVMSLNEKGENACNATVLSTFIIGIVQKEINRTVAYLKYRQTEVNDGILENINEMLSNSLVCSTADHLARIEIYWLLFISIVFIGCFEIILTYNHAYYGLGTLVGKISSHMIWKEFWLRIMCGCLANIVACIVGYFTLSTSAYNPYFIYFVTYVPSAIALRSIFIVVLGIIFDAIYPSCGVSKTYLRKAQHRRTQWTSGIVLPIFTGILMVVALVSMFSGDILSITSMS